MDLAEKLLPQTPSSDAQQTDVAALGDLRAKLQTLLAEMRRERPEPGSDSEAAMLLRMSLFGAEATKRLGPGYVALLRAGIHAAIGDLVRKELETAEVERKLALRHIEQAGHTLGVLAESLGALLTTVPAGSLSGLLDELAALGVAGRVSMGDSERVVARFQLDVLVAMDAMDAPLDELTYWAYRAITGARKVNAMPSAEMLGGLHGLLARVRARRAWQSWDEAELAEELAPWPAAPSR